jgi:4-hydroxy-2-oxoheptanedioate aldolase
VYRFKELLRDGQLCRVFTVGRIIHPVVFDVHGMVGGFHGFWIDQEHAGVTYEQIALASCCGRAQGLDNFVRMAMEGYARATANLEAGAGGLMAARIESAEHAEEFMQWVKFAPRGNRGLNSSGYDAQYGGQSLTQYSANSNRDSFVAIQIETTGALEQCDQIAAMDGVDLLFVGPSDLSQVLGVIGQFDSPTLWDAYNRVAAACKKHGKHWGTIAVNPAFAKRAYDLGCRMLSFGIEAIMLRRGIEATKGQFKELFG